MNRHLVPDEIERYSRQLILKSWSEEFQLHLKNLSVCIPASCPFVALQLSALGFGRIVICGEDADTLGKEIQMRNSSIKIEVAREVGEIDDVDIALSVSGTNPIPATFSVRMGGIETSIESLLTGQVTAESLCALKFLEIAQKLHSATV